MHSSLCPFFDFTLSPCPPSPEREGGTYSILLPLLKERVGVRWKSEREKDE
jgi:hypothetical protein